jgi:hypothetical protein
VATEHEQAIRAAQQTVDELGSLFAQIGTAEHPNGQVLAAYRTARAALGGNLDNLASVEDALGTLRLAVERASDELLRQAADLGLKQAGTELAIYGLRAEGSVGAQTSEALRTIVAVLESQVQAVRTIALMGADEALAIGDEGRVGILTPGSLTAELSKWLGQIAGLAYDDVIQGSVGQAGAQDEFMRQAVAAADERTTQTCLLVHAQVVEIDGEFELRGTPRFADKMRCPSFHWWCRTAIALVRRQYAEDDLTQEMRSAAQAELQAREETGTLVEIHPAHARSRR